VADALLNVVYDRVSGEDEFGRVIYGSKPSSLFICGFLLPRQQMDNGDEVTSPICISSHGLDFQVDLEEKGAIIIRPEFGVYVRVLPSEADMQNRGDCRPHFRLTRDVSRNLQKQIKEALNAEWEKIKDQYISRRSCPEWDNIKYGVRAQVLKENGLPANLDIVQVPAAEESAMGEDDVGQGEIVAIETASDTPVRDELYDPVNIPHKWFRLPIRLAELTLDPHWDDGTRKAAIEAHQEEMQKAIETSIATWLEDENPEFGGKLWAYRTGMVAKPSDYRDWDSFLARIREANNRHAIPTIKAGWNIEVTPDWFDPARTNIHIAIENRSDSPKQRKDETEQAMFQVCLEAEIPKTMHRRLRLERVKPSYRYNRYLSYPAIGYNGGVVEKPSEGHVKLKTTWTPRYHQPRIIPTSYAGTILGIRDLSMPMGLSGLQPIVSAFSDWLNKLPGEIKLDAGIEGDRDAVAKEENQFKKDLANWESEKAAIETGITILEESKKHWVQRGPQSDPIAIPFEAWLAMNESMADLMKGRTGSDNTQWRLFQIAFILANLPSLVTRLPEFVDDYYLDKRDDAVTLLYFATGGGKSEAFFGLLLFGLFLDRLRGKSFGITAMVRYPLRLLTIQQAQRAAKVLAQGELVRRRCGYEGQPFSIGFWVGSGGSPNWLRSKGVSDIPYVEKCSKDEDDLRETDPNYNAANRAWNKLPSCPFCGSQTGLRRFPKNGGLLGHACTNPECDWNGGGVTPLPFYICDEDIYALAPSVLLGTVDKLALIGHSARTIRHVLGMFGIAPWRKSDTGRLYAPDANELRDGPARHKCHTLFPAYSDGEKLFKDPFPALLIQDEAHLLDESLGTFAGLFESTLDAVLENISGCMSSIVAKDKDGKRRRAKVVAASATVSEPERQLEHLFQRKIPALQFPFPGPDIYHSFYATAQDPNSDEAGRVSLPKEETELRSRIARIYCAFMTNGRPHTTTTVSLLANFHLTITDLFERLTSGDSTKQESARNQLCRHLSDTPIRNVLDAKLRTATFEDIATLIDLHRIALTYVTNKKGGDQIMAAEAEECRKLHQANGYQMDGLHARLITGSVEQGEIQKTVEIAQWRVSPGEDIPSLVDALRSIVATSAVSHGVDVEEFNSMFFAGMPSDIAEYIQASSRIGRAHVGLCVLVPTPQRRRDRYIVEVFDIFHRFLERMVQPAAIDRWAERAVQRVIPSLFQAYMCGVDAACKFVSLGDNDKKEWKDNASIPDFIPEFDGNAIQLIHRITDFLSQAIGLRDGYAPEGGEYYQSMVKERVRIMLNGMSEKSHRNSALRTFFDSIPDTLQQPMTSLRDVDQAGQIRLSRKDDSGNKIIDEDIRDIMALIRHGQAETGDEEEWIGQGG
jgi:hypothetical protein